MDLLFQNMQKHRFLCIFFSKLCFTNGEFIYIYILGDRFKFDPRQARLISSFPNYWPEVPVSWRLSFLPFVPVAHLNSAGILLKWYIIKMDLELGCCVWKKRILI